MLRKRPPARSAKNRSVCFFKRQMFFVTMMNECLKVKKWKKAEKAEGFDYRLVLLRRATSGNMLNAEAPPDATKVLLRLHR